MIYLDSGEKQVWAHLQQAGVAEQPVYLSRGEVAGAVSLINKLFKLHQNALDKIDRMSPRSEPQ